MPGNNRSDTAQKGLKESFGITELKNMEDRLITAITDCKTELKRDIDSVRDEVKKARADFTTELAELNEKVQDDLEDCKKELRDEIDKLRDDVERLEYHQRKYNLLFYGLKAKQGEEMKAIFSLCRDKLKIDLDAAAFVNVHKVGKEGTIARFARWEDRQAVLTNSKKLSGSNIGIRTDLPSRIQAKRTLLLNKRKELKAAGKIVRVVERNRDVCLQTKRTAEGDWETID